MAEPDVIVKPRDVMPTDARTLPASFYTDPAYFERELDRLFRQRWICIGRTEEIASPGQFVLLRTLPGAGHVGWPRSVMLDALAEEVAFLEAALMGRQR